MIAKLPSRKYTQKSGHIASVAYWLYRCVCGQERAASASSLRRGKVTSCGCEGRKRQVQAARKAPGHSGMTQVILTYKRHARNRGLEFNLTREEFADIANKDCHYCGAPPSMVSSQAKTRGYSAEGAKLSEFIYNGIDRVDSSVGYSVGNCVPCCNACNIAKSDMPVDDFRAWVLRAYNHMYGKAAP